MIYAKIEPTSNNNDDRRKEINFYPYTEWMNSEAIEKYIIEEFGASDDHTIFAGATGISIESNKEDGTDGFEDYECLHILAYLGFTPISETFFFKN
jgi:hypothetical protein